MKIPYGIADFERIRAEDFLYVDRTDRIRTLEDTGSALLFLRPRRFGKSLWISTLASYYDLRGEASHAKTFHGLAAGEDPTPLAHAYFVLTWDFSNIDPDPPPLDDRLAAMSRVERIGNEIHAYVTTSLKSFASDYREHLPEPLEIETDAFRSLDHLLAALRRLGRPLYLLIDEYDNFANEVMTSEPEVYEELVHTDGPLKRLFKWVKAAMRGQGLERLFMTGVSPVTMSDITSGLNIAENVYLYPELADLCGFTDGEVRQIVERLHVEQAAEPVTWSVDEALGMMREWYNGYRFALEPGAKVYNPTLVFYFLKHLQRTGKYPRQILDSNLAADEAKLEYLGQAAAGQKAILELIHGGEPLEISQLEDRFTLRAMLERSAQDASFLGSFLYYFGMLTLEGETDFRGLLLSPPNQVIYKLYVERVRRLLMPSGEARTASFPPARALFQSGNLEPLLDFIEGTIFATLSNRDALWANELTVKTVFLTLLWNDVSHVFHSEPELEHRYADLCLLRRPDARDSSLVDLLFEFKRLSLAEVGLAGETVKAASREELARHPAVARALNEAEAQLASYRATLEKRFAGALELSAWAVVALGFERLVSRPVRA